MKHRDILLKPTESKPKPTKSKPKPKKKGAKK